MTKFGKVCTQKSYFSVAPAHFAWAGLKGAAILVLLAGINWLGGLSLGRLAYYKLCAMAWVLENRDFARAAMLDLDTFTQRPLDDLWRECDEAVLLYQVPHAASQTMTAAISRCFDAVEPDGAPHALTHFGGELVAGSRARLTDFMSLCRYYFEELQAKGITPREGDEAVWCGAAYRSLLAGKPVRAANAYIFRYWLGGHFYYVSTNYTLDPVCILHLPGAPAQGGTQTRARQTR